METQDSVVESGSESDSQQGSQQEVNEEFGESPIVEQGDSENLADILSKLKNRVDRRMETMTSSEENRRLFRLLADNYPEYLWYYDPYKSPNRSLYIYEACKALKLA